MHHPKKLSFCWKNIDEKCTEIEAVLRKPRYFLIENDWFFEFTYTSQFLGQSSAVISVTNYSVMCNPQFKFILPLQFCVISFFFVIFPFFRYSLYWNSLFWPQLFSLIVLCLYNIGKIVGFGYFGYYSFTFPVFFISVGISRHILRDWKTSAPSGGHNEEPPGRINEVSFNQNTINVSVKYSLM